MLVVEQRVDVPFCRGPPRLEADHSRGAADSHNGKTHFVNSLQGAVVTGFGFDSNEMGLV